MSDKVKLIIEIPKKDYEWAIKIKEELNYVVYCDRQILAIANGTPLDEDLESLRAEVQAYFAGEAYGWEQGRKSLIEDIKAEIAVQYANTHHTYPEYADGLTCASQIIDRYTESEDKE